MLLVSSAWPSLGAARGAPVVRAGRLRAGAGAGAGGRMARAPCARPTRAARAVLLGAMVAASAGLVVWRAGAGAGGADVELVAAGPPLGAASGGHGGGGSGDGGMHNRVGGGGSDVGIVSDARGGAGSRAREEQRRADVPGDSRDDGGGSSSGGGAAAGGGGAAAGGGGAAAGGGSSSSGGGAASSTGATDGASTGAPERGSIGAPVRGGGAGASQSRGGAGADDAAGTYSGGGGGSGHGVSSRAADGNASSSGGRGAVTEAWARRLDDRIRDVGATAHAQYVELVRARGGGPRAPIMSPEHVPSLATLDGCEFDAPGRASPLCVGPPLPPTGTTAVSNPAVLAAYLTARKDYSGALPALRAGPAALRAFFAGEGEPHPVLVFPRACVALNGVVARRGSYETFPHPSCNWQSEPMWGDAAAGGGGHSLLVDVSQFAGEQFYHFVVEGAARLAVVLDYVAARPGTVVHVTDRSRGFLVEWMGWLGVPMSRVVDGTACADTVIVPAPYARDLYACAFPIDTRAHFLCAPPPFGMCANP